ncbi:MAG: ATPase domain-containing protein [Candidatus Micrarchaeales archaeon]
MADKVERLSTGIAGLDGMLFGGVPLTNEVLIAGGPGSGKTLLCFEILYRNAKAGVPSLFISLEEKPEEIIKNAKSAFPELAIDIDAMIASKALSIISGDTPLEMGTDNERDLISAFAKVNAGIEESIKSTNAKVIAVDSISVLKLVSSKGGALTYRRGILGLMSTIRRLGVTAFLTIELASTERGDIKFSSEFFIFDGIIVMYQSESEERRSFNLEIVKMRRTNHSLSFAPYEITPRGYRILVVDQSISY